MILGLFPCWFYGVICAKLGKIRAKRHPQPVWAAGILISND
jgi:hypothetical protein